MIKFKYSISVIILFLVCLGCKAQKPKLKDLSINQEMNYVLANIWSGPIYYKELFHEGVHIKIFQMNDSKATSEKLFEGYDGTLSSLIITVTPDGDYYTNSKLYKIEGIYNAKILEIKETTYPNFSIKIEYGFPDKRKTDVFEFEGVQ